MDLTSKACLLSGVTGHPGVILLSLPLRLQDRQPHRFPTKISAIHSPLGRAGTGSRKRPLHMPAGCQTHMGLVYSQSHGTPDVPKGAHCRVRQLFCSVQPCGRALVVLSSWGSFPEMLPRNISRIVLVTPEHCTSLACAFLAKILHQYLEKGKLVASFLSWTLLWICGVLGYGSWWWIHNRS